MRFTFDETIKMIEQGVLPEDATIELLDGALVYRDRFDLRGSEIVEGVRHNFVVSALADLAFRINTEKRHLRTQGTLVCSPSHAPIPDAAILRGTLRDYRDRLPTAADAYCVVEVADSSYERDTGEKLIGYARAGLAQYVIINLRNRTAEIHTAPEAAAGKFAAVRVIREDESLALRVADYEFVDVPLGQLLP